MGRPRRSLPELPHEIIFWEILPRLPAKSLLGFKLVCKKWRDLISDPDFIHTHLLHLNQQPSSTKQLNVLFANYKGMLYSRTIKSNVSSSIQVARNRLPPTNWFDPMENMGLRFVGSCNGLICLVINYYDALGLWNPCTGSYRSLGYDRSLWSSSLGFGYDDNTKDFKLVKIDEEERTATDGVEVFTLSSNSCRTIPDGLNCPVDLTESGKFIDGVLYWVNFGEVYSAICFDIHDEVFSELSLPDVSPEDVCEIEIEDIGGCLALARELNCILLEVWVRKENWVKMYSFDASSCGHSIVDLIPLGGIDVIRRKNENHVDQVIYVSKSLYRSFFSFNPSTNQLSPFPFPDDASYSAECDSIITYVESLASVNPEQ